MVFVGVSEGTVTFFGFVDCFKASLVCKVVKLFCPVSRGQHVNDSVIPVINNTLSIIWVPALFGHDSVPNGLRHIRTHVKLPPVTQYKNRLAEDLLLGECQISPNILNSPLGRDEVRAPGDLLVECLV
jgi:hypothetical protein